MKRSLEQLFEENNGASPILRPNTTGVNDDYESSEDEEIIFTQQANKKRKMSAEDQMKIWITGEFTKHLSALATKDQLTSLITAVDRNTVTSQANASALAKQQLELQNLRGSIETVEMELHGKRRRTDNVNTTKLLATGTYAGAAMMSPRRTINQGMNSLNKISRPERFEAERKNFEKARRSLRMWPIVGSSAEEMSELVCT